MQETTGSQLDIMMEIQMINETLNNITPTAIVQESDDRQSALYWHEQGLAAETKRSRGTFEQAESWYQLEKTGGYTQFGFESIGEYVYSNFSKSSATANKYIDAHKKLVVDLGRTVDELSEVGAGKLFIALSHINAENVEDMLSELKKMSQKEISDKIRDEDPQKIHDKKSINFKGPSEMIEAVESSLELAKAEVCSMSAFKTPEQVPDLSALGHICATWNGMVDLDGNAVNTLETALKSLEHAFNINITWKEKDE